VGTDQEKPYYRTPRSGQFGLVEAVPLGNMPELKMWMNMELEKRDRGQLECSAGDLERC
jgi:hypothetical protein